MSLKVTSRPADGVTVLDLSGRIVLGEGSLILRQALDDLAARGCQRILLNLADVNYMDSSGLGAIIGGFTSVKAGQGQLKLLNPTTKVHDLWQIAKLLTVFEVYGDENAAIESFS